MAGVKESGQQGAQQCALVLAAGPERGAGGAGERGCGLSPQPCRVGSQVDEEPADGVTGTTPGAVRSWGSADPAAGRTPPCDGLVAPATSVSGGWAASVRMWRAGAAQVRAGVVVSSQVSMASSAQAPQAVMWA